MSQVLGNMIWWWLLNCIFIHYCHDCKRIESRFSGLSGIKRVQATRNLQKAHYSYGPRPYDCTLTNRAANNGQGFLTKTKCKARQKQVGHWKNLDHDRSKTKGTQRFITFFPWKPFHDIGTSALKTARNTARSDVHRQTDSSIELGSWLAFWKNIVHL